MNRQQLSYRLKIFIIFFLIDSACSGGVKPRFVSVASAYMYPKTPDMKLTFKQLIFQILKQIISMVKKSVEKREIHIFLDLLEIITSSFALILLVK